MTRPLTPFRLGEVITGEPQLYVANRPASLDSAVETGQTKRSKERHHFKRFAAAIQRRFRLSPTPEAARATAHIAID